MKSIQLLDKKIILKINKKRTHHLDIIFTIITNLASDLAAIFYLLILALLPSAIFRPILFKAAISMSISALLVRTIKNIIKRKRPYDSLKDIRALKVGVDTFSFPSGHTTTAFTFAVSISLMLLNPMTTVFLVTLAFLIAFSRLYLGVHYPSDILVGMILGSSISLFVYFII